MRDIGVPLMRKAFDKTAGPLSDSSHLEPERGALMTPHHQALRDSLHLLAGTGSPAHQGSGAYTGSPHRLLGITTPGLRRLARRWVAANGALSPEAVLAVADSLFLSEIHDEKTLGALIVGYSKAARRAAVPLRVEGWLDGLVGWAEVDALCSNVFQAEEFFAAWPEWNAWLRGWAADPNINKRRASLVLLTGPVRHSDDPRLLTLALANLADLHAERPILITKAVSWLLRNLIARHRDAVVRYLEANRAALPAIAVREVSTKLSTGRKSVRAVGRDRAGAGSNAPD
jgi:3-methyladenine DNA glycosylase AlkD